MKKVSFPHPPFLPPPLLFLCDERGLELEIYATSAVQTTHTFTHLSKVIYEQSFPFWPGSSGKYRLYSAANAQPTRKNSNHIETRAHICFICVIISPRPHSTMTSPPSFLFQQISGTVQHFVVNFRGNLFSQHHAAKRSAQHTSAGWRHHHRELPLTANINLNYNF